MPAFIFLELGIALLLVAGVWGWLHWHRPRDEAAPPAKRNPEGVIRD